MNAGTYKGSGIFISESMYENQNRFVVIADLHMKLCIIISKSVCKHPKSGIIIRSFSGDKRNFLILYTPI